MKNQIKLIVPAISEALEISCRASQLSQVLLNLLNNAFDAVEDLAERWVSLEVCETDPASITFHVTDSGNGLTQDIREKVYIPFFTTKKEGKGTGLGLSISKSIIESHNGTMEIDLNSPNTRFVIRIPRQQAAVDGIVA